MGCVPFRSNSHHIRTDQEIDQIVRQCEPKGRKGAKFMDLDLFARSIGQRCHYFGTSPAGESGLGCWSAGEVLVPGAALTLGFAGSELGVVVTPGCALPSFDPEAGLASD